MNAKRFQPELKIGVKVANTESPLKFLSPYQKEKSDALANEWKAFNNDLFGKIINKM